MKHMDISMWVTWTPSCESLLQRGTCSLKAASHRTAAWEAGTHWLLVTKKELTGVFRFLVWLYISSYFKSYYCWNSYKKNIAVVGLKLITVTFSDEILMFVTQFSSFGGKGERILRFQLSIQSVRQSDHIFKSRNKDILELWDGVIVSKTYIFYSY